MERRTWSPKPSDIERKWYVVDADGQTLGRLATAIATTLRGKNKPTFASHMDSGDYVIVLNADKITVTGNKEAEKNYYRHSGYPGGLTTTTLRDMRARHPDRIIRSAVKGMLPKNALGEQQLKKLKVYVGSEHPHNSHSPEELTVKGSRRPTTWPTKSDINTEPDAESRRLPECVCTPATETSRSTTKG